MHRRILRCATSQYELYTKDKVSLGNEPAKSLAESSYEEVVRFIIGNPYMISRVNTRSLNVWGIVSLLEGMFGGVNAIFQRLLFMPVRPRMLEYPSCYPGIVKYSQGFAVSSYEVLSA